VARLLQEHEDVVLAAAYGVPCPVSDEWVMAALKLRPGASFEPQGFFDFCDGLIDHGGMDRKWFPDFVRVVDEFEYTKTQKVLVRNLKQVHFDLPRLAGAAVYFRTRGDTSFRPFAPADYEALRGEFERGERLELLDR
jgi:fatty-acyl-CoA synthase